jgi:hypothetical protein
MERNKKVYFDWLCQYGLQGTILYLAGEEVSIFIRQGGLLNPLGSSLLKITLYLFLFLFLHKNSSSIEVENLHRTILKILEEIRSLRHAEDKISDSK